MNLVRGLHYFTYLNIFLLISFHRADSFNYKIAAGEIMNSIRPTNAENDATHGVEREFSLICQQYIRKLLPRFKSAFKFLWKKIEDNILEHPLHSFIPSLSSRDHIIAILRTILMEKLILLKANNTNNLKDFCNKTWALCSDIKDASASAQIFLNTSLPVYISQEEEGGEEDLEEEEEGGEEDLEEEEEGGEEEEDERKENEEEEIENPVQQQEVEIIKVPTLLCSNAGVTAYILTLYDDRNPSEDIHFIYASKDKNNYLLLGYIRKIFH